MFWSQLLAHTAWHQTCGMRFVVAAMHGAYVHKNLSFLSIGFFLVYSMASEHTPLLQNSNDNEILRSLQPIKPSRPKLGPMEISASNRRAILVGIWMATFLSVSARSFAGRRT